MDERKNESRHQAEGKKSGILWKILSFVVILTVVLAVVAVSAYRNGTGFDVLRRYMNYGSAERVGGSTIYDYDDASSNIFAALEDRLVVACDRSIQILDQSSNVIWSKSVDMAAPAIAQGGNRVAVYDVGGTELYVLNGEGQELYLQGSEDAPILAASLNADGWLAVTAEKKNYKACVSVYDGELEKVFEFNSSRRFVVDAYVADRNTHLAAVTLGQENGGFVSNVVLYDLKETEPKANFDIADALVLETGEKDGLLTAVADTVLTFAETDGQVRATYSYAGEYLQEYDLGGDGFVALLLNRYRSGSMGRIVTVDSSGNELGSLEVNEEVSDLCAAGKYLAVLYGDTVVIYDREMHVYASLKGAEHIRSVLMRTDGSALLLGAESAELYLP